MTNSRFQELLRQYLAKQGIVLGENPPTEEQKARMKAIPARAFINWLRQNK